MAQVAIFMLIYAVLNRLSFVIEIFLTWVIIHHGCVHCMYLDRLMEQKNQHCQTQQFFLQGLRCHSKSRVTFFGLGIDLAAVAHKRGSRTCEESLTGTSDLHFVQMSRDTDNRVHVKRLSRNPLIYTAQ